MHLWPQGMHVFTCVSKSPCHNYIHEGLTATLPHPLSTAYVIPPSVTIYIEPNDIISSAPGCCPFDIQADPTFITHEHPPCPYTEVGFDITIMLTQGHSPPAQICTRSPETPTIAVCKP